MLYSTTYGLSGKSGKNNYFRLDVTKAGFVRIMYGKRVFRHTYLIY